jgi:hypothetical protein
MFFIAFCFAIHFLLVTSYTVFCNRRRHFLISLGYIGFIIVVSLLLHLQPPPYIFQTSVTTCQIPPLLSSSRKSNYLLSHQSISTALRSIVSRFCCPLTVRSDRFYDAPLRHSCVTFFIAPSALFPPSYRYSPISRHD